MSVYLDHAATAPLRAEARDAWLAASEIVGNASSTHRDGQRARRLLEDARDRIAAVLGCQAIEVVLTSGGTESVNLAVKGLWWARRAGAETVVLPAGEHHATRDAVAWLESSQHATVREVPLDRLGAVEASAWRDAVVDAAFATALVANNECGTVNDAPGLAAAAAAASTPLHLDAIGAVGSVEVSFERWRGDAGGSGGLVALSLSGHKLGAPVGTGALVVSRHARLAPLVHGGGQQRGLRSGTQDLAGAAGLAAALECAEREREAEARRLGALRDRLIAGIRRDIPESVLLGHPRDRLPGNVHVLFPGAVGETLLFLLDSAGISASTGAACQAGVSEPSHVVLALGRTAADARSVLRMTLGRTSTDADVDAVLAALPDAYRRAVAAGG